MIRILLIFGLLLAAGSGVQAQESRFPIEMENGLTFYPGQYTLDDKPGKRGYLHFDRPKQRLLILDQDEIFEYNASEVQGFSYIFQSGTPYAEELRFISWKFQKDWPAYEQMTFFQVLGDYSNCAIVSADRKPTVTDQYPDSSEVFYARLAQGKTYHLILPDGSIVKYDRQTVDKYLRIILKNDYPEVMLYAHDHGLRPTRFVDLFTILDYAENLNLP